MKTVRDCLEDIRTKIVMSEIVKSMTIVAERALTDRGYFRARLCLVNDDFLEVSEYFIVEPDRCSTIEYSYQWMDNSKQRLIKRWDNAEHFPDLTNFPHHIHVGSDTNVIPGTVMSIIELTDLLEAEIAARVETEN